MGRTGQQMRARTKQAMVANAKVVPAKPRRNATYSRGQRLRYAFDTSMSRGTKALVGWLAVVSLALMLVFAVLLMITGLSPKDADGKRPGFFAELFNSFIHTLDAGTVAGDGASSWRYVVLMIVLTIGGLFIVSALIGVIATGIDNKLVDLRRGRSLVIEHDHTVILGWSDAVFTIISELAVANESRRRPVVVVLAERDKVEMEDELRDKLPDLRGTRVVCRTGSPMDIGDLALTSHDSARSVVVLSPGGEEPDSEVIKVLLALTHGAAGEAHVVAEIEDPRNLEAARLVGGDRAVILNKQETIARLIVQTSRQAGAAAVYKELFDFDGDEIYFHREPRLDGQSYAQVLHAYEDVSVIGVVRDDVVTLNPPGDTDVTGCDLVVVAADDSALGSLRSASAPVDETVIVARAVTPQAPTRTLVLGWNQRATSVIRELDAYAVAGSELVVVSAFGDPALPPLSAYTATVQRASTSERSSLETLGVERFDQIIVLCYSDDLDLQKADARTLITLLHVRDLIGSTVDGGPALVSEMLDDRNRALANVAEVDDVIVSDEIVSLMLAQLSEEGRLEVIFDELLQEAGSEIYLRPVAEYVELGAEVSYATLVEAAARRGETAIGYRTALQAHDADAGYGVRVNPAKSTPVRPVAADRLVVLAED
ncbi:potassium transporter TrkA [Nocardioides mangrovicus]|uniref:Potassium transporter TrkA n=1 Tax=Nocardioides mangrovicus TaxID=2478913 RepID=A0A3L8NXN6_9ACTN|nr:NAD-binding protein [Nocardioides mangrovicus]RLV47910.1 potassium transporter TrkA [Nocardioides mangrovicus]